MRRLLLLTPCPWLVGLLPLEAYDPFDPDIDRPRMVRVQLEFVELEQGKCMELMNQTRSAADATGLRRQVVDLVRNDEAVVVETMMVVARSGERATVGSMSERIYPAEYEPPDGLPGSFLKGSPDAISGAYDFRPLASLVTAPTSFETRNVGSSFEISPVIGFSNELIDVQVSPEMVRFAGYKVHQERVDHQGDLHQDKHPIFESRQLKNSVVCRDGEYVLLSTLPSFSEGDGEERKLMVFLKCDVLVVKESNE